jgi:acetyltransferase-like isoleucine patch superfamily enzyme
MFREKIKGRLINWYEALRIRKYKFLSDSKRVSGNPVYVQPVLISGMGKVIFGHNIYLGTRQSPLFYSGYIYINTRHANAEIIIEDGVWTNNNLTLISQEAGIFIGRNTLIGMNVEIYDCDFHPVDPTQRKAGILESRKVSIGSNVWIGSNVNILNGVTVGDNSIIGNSSVVTVSIPANEIWGGVPAKFIKSINGES